LAYFCQIAIQVHVQTEIQSVILHSGTHNRYL